MKKILVVFLIVFLISFVFADYNNEADIVLDSITNPIHSEEVEEDEQDIEIIIVDEDDNSEQDD
jgi:uncharacterized membrane protein